MIVLSLALLAFAVVDLLRWSPDHVPATRARFALVAATAVTSAMSALSGFHAGDVAFVAVATLFVLTVWLLLDALPPKRSAPAYPLAWILTVVIVAIAVTGSRDPVSGPLERWYTNLPFTATQSISVDQFLLGASAGLFLLASANRVVRLVLEAAGTPVTAGETALKGGRLLGPMERLVVAAMILAGDLTGPAVVIAAKGLTSSAGDPHQQRSAWRRGRSGHRVFPDRHAVQPPCGRRTRRTGISCWLIPRDISGMS